MHYCITHTHLFAFHQQDDMRNLLRNLPEAKPIDYEKRCKIKTKSNNYVPFTPLRGMYVHKISHTTAKE